MDVREYTEVFPSALPAARHDDFRAWVSIAPGCDNACTFCIVPARPRAAALTLDRRHPGGGAGRSPQRGVVEVTLLGQNVNTYGRDVTVPGSSNRPLFAELLRQVGAVDGIRRVRFTSPHPHDFTPDVIDAMAETPAVCEHIHFPLQSGSDRVLKAMRRSYRRDRYLGWLERDPRRPSPTSRCPPTSSSGSPARPRRTSRRRWTWSSGRGSTARTCSSTRRARARGRPSFDDQIPKEVVQERFDRLVELQERISLERSLAQVGAHVRGARGGCGEARTVDPGAHAHQPHRAPPRRAGARVRSRTPGSWRRRRTT